MHLDSTLRSSLAMSWWLSALFCGLLVGGSLGRTVVQRPEMSELSKISPVKYFITGEKDAHGHWTEQVKMEHGEEDWHYEVDHVTLDVGEGAPKVKITATFSAKSNTADAKMEKPEVSSELYESEEVERVFQLFPRSHRDWFGAKIQCEEWGGHLAVPDTLAKTRKLTSILRQHVDDIGEPTGAFLGFDDLKEEGHFVTVLGKPLFSLRGSKWSPDWYQTNQPDDDKSWTKDGEDCGSMRPNGGLNDVPCRYNLPFICEKAPGKEGTGSTAVPEVEHEATLHLFSHSYKDWFDAKKACVEWGGNLAIPDTEAKLQKMVNMLKSTEGILEHVNAFVGINDIKEEGHFVTIFGKPVFSSGAEWSPRWFNPKQPDNDKSWTIEGEDCGGVHPAGGLNDLPCGYRLPYFCDKTAPPDADTTPEETDDDEEQEEDVATRDEEVEDFDADTTSVEADDDGAQEEEEAEEEEEDVDALRLFDRDDLHWFDARDACQEWGGHLAIPDSAEKIEVMALKMKLDQVSAAFLGFSDQKEEGNFVTIFGTPVFRESSWSPHWWRDDQPDDDKTWFADGEDCGSVRADGGLNDVPCRHQMPFFCEKPLSAAGRQESEGDAASERETTVLGSGQVSSSEQEQSVASIENLLSSDEAAVQLQTIDFNTNKLGSDEIWSSVQRNEVDSSVDRISSQMVPATQKPPTVDDVLKVFRRRVDGSPFHSQHTVNAQTQQTQQSVASNETRTQLSSDEAAARRQAAYLDKQISGGTSGVEVGEE